MELSTMYFLKKLVTGLAGVPSIAKDWRDNQHQADEGKDSGRRLTKLEQ